MKKALSFALSLILVISAIIPAISVSADANSDWLNSLPDGTVVFVPDFNGTAGVYEPGYLSGTPVATVDPTNPNTLTMETSKDKSASYWGGFIENLPLNETTCYTIYYTVTRSGKHSVGVYCDSVYGAYGYPERIKLMQKGSSLPGHDYMYFETVGIDVPKLDLTTVTHEYALEVNGVNSVIAIYVKNNAGQFELVDQSLPDEIPYFNADVLGLFFYSYYAGHIVTISDCYIAKGLAFGEVTIPETTPEPETTKAPETEAPVETTKEPETEAPATEAPATEAPATEAPATEAPVVTKAPETTKAPEKSGCGAVISGSAIIAIIGTAVTLFIKKKRD